MSTLTLMTWAEKVFAITLFIEDTQKTEDFYTNIFERQPVYKDQNGVVYDFNGLLINLLQEDEAPDLIGPAHPATKEVGHRFQLTIPVVDIDQRVEALKAQGVQFINGPMDRSWGIRTALFSDPDGHLWELSEPLA